MGMRWLLNTRNSVGPTGASDSGVTRGFGAAGVLRVGRGGTGGMVGVWRRSASLPTAAPRAEPSPAGPSAEPGGGGGCVGARVRGGVMVGPLATAAVCGGVGRLLAEL